MKIEIYRHKFTVDKRQTLGTLCVITDYETVLYSCKTLELPWKDNEKKVSCIKDGKYKVTKHISPKFGLCFKVHGTIDRSEILIHSGNYKRQTEGCILVGENFKDLDGDKLTDITNSKKTLNELINILPSEFNLIIYK